MSEGVRDAHPRDLSSGNIPAFARPLVDQMTAAGVVVRWDLAEAEWFTLDALLKRSGADMLAAHATRTAQRRNVAHARYFLRAWRDLPPAPAPGTTAPTAAADVIPLDRHQPRKGRAAQAADWYADLLAEETP
ncbi:hypothetical protein ACIGW3_11420 [Streptomyces sp. NPDC053499]|uniref:hypothetical protein n=1 Tax=Streptomyces sp. NPDC053499 TaxID=3365707 RepID=UPI0037CEB095